MEERFEELIAEFIQKMRDEGQSEDYIQGALYGYTYAHHIVLMLTILDTNKNKYMMQEFQVANV